MRQNEKHLIFEIALGKEKRMDAILQHLPTADAPGGSKTECYESYFDPERKFSISAHMRSQFWREYLTIANEPLEARAHFLRYGERVSVMPFAFGITLKMQQVDYHSDESDDEYAAAVSREAPWWQSFVDNICEICLAVIRTAFNICNEEALSHIAISSDSVETPDGFLVRGLRIYFPLIRAVPKLLRNQIYSLMLQYLNSVNILSLFPRKPFGDWIEMVDYSLTESLPLYGSCRAIGDLQFRNVHIYGIERGLRIEKQMGALTELFRVEMHEFIASGTLQTGALTDGVAPLMTSFFLPLILSCSYSHTPTDIQATIEATISGGEFEQEPEIREAMEYFAMIADVTVSRYVSDPSVGHALFGVYNSVDRAEEGLEFWVKRVMEAVRRYKGRIKIGSLVFQCPTTDNVGPQVREQLSSIYWNSEEASPKSLKTLAWFARIDSAVKYKQYRDKIIHEQMTKCRSQERGGPCDADVVQLLYSIYWLDYAYCTEKGEWYFFKGLQKVRGVPSGKPKHFQWKPLSDGEIDIGHRINTEVVLLVESFRAEVLEQARKEEKATLKAASAVRKEHRMNDSSLSRFQTVHDSESVCKRKLADIDALIRALKGTTSKAKIIRGAQETFHISEFTSRLNRSRTLMGVQNGVIELNDRGAHFRPGIPEDYISLSTMRIYREDFYLKGNIEDISGPDPSKISPELWNLLYYMHQTYGYYQTQTVAFAQGHSMADGKLYCGGDYVGDVESVDEAGGTCTISFYKTDVVLFMLKELFPSILYGGNRDKKFICINGPTDGGKSTLVHLLEKTLGEYLIKFPTTIVTGNKPLSSAPQPELARSQGARMGIMEEPDDEEKIRAGPVKNLTGNDSFFARFLYDNGHEIENTFKLALISNTIPVIPKGGKATQERLLSIVHRTRYIDDPPPEDQRFKAKLFKNDRDFSQKLDGMAEALLWFMAHFYGHYITKGLHIPQTMREDSRNYWENSDIYRVFFNAYLEPVIDATDPSGKRLLSTVSLSVGEAYSAFKLWYSNSFAGRRPEDINSFVDGVNNVFGYNATHFGRGRSMESMAWKGLRMRESPGPSV